MNRIGLGLALALATAVGCSSPQSGTTIGQPPTVSRTCTVAKADNGAFEYGVTSGALPVLVTIDNKRCPYAVRAVGAVVSAAFEMKRRYPAGMSLGPANVTIFNADRSGVGSAFAGWTSEFGCQNPTQFTCWQVKPTTTYSGGTGTGRDGKPRDSVYVFFQTGAPGTINNNGLAAGFAILPAEINPAAHTVSPSGPTALARTVTFQNSTAIDTGHFLYEWAIDGATVAGAHGARLSTVFATPGTRTITSKAIYADQTAIVTTTVVHADLRVDIAGPVTLSLGHTGSWSVVGDPGGTAPLSYQWAIDGAVQGFSSDVSASFNSVGYHSVSATVTDAAGFTKTTTLMVNVEDCTDNCQQTRIIKAWPGAQRTP